MKNKLKAIFLTLILSASLAQANTKTDNFTMLAILDMALVEGSVNNESSSEVLLENLQQQDGVVAENPELAKRSFELIRMHFETVNQNSIETLKIILEHKHLGNIDEITKEANVHALPLESVHAAIREILEMNE